MVRDAYRALLDSVAGLDEETGWRETRCAGWVVRDLVFHLLGDAQRALVALHTPVSGPADVDAIGYWAGWRAGADGSAANLRAVRTMASCHSSVGEIAGTYAETALAVLDAARHRPADDVVATQGHAITVGDLCSTLAVEATVHQLDLRLGAPAESGLAEVRRVLDGLLGRPAPIADPVRYALVGTGRERPTAEEAALLGADAARLPLFG